MDLEISLECSKETTTGPLHWVSLIQSTPSQEGIYVHFNRPWEAQRSIHHYKYDVWFNDSAILNNLNTPAAVSRSVYRKKDIDNLGRISLGRNATPV